MHHSQEATSTIMETNPWLWDIQQVANFFRHDASNFMRDTLNPPLPDVEHLASVLQENDVNGSVLLGGAVEANFLKNDCGIKSLGKISAVMNCIHRLNKLAAHFDDRAANGGPAPDTPKSISAHISMVQQQTPHPSFDDATPGEHVRAGEVQVQDNDGRKRRKLNLLESAKPLQSIEAATSAAYFNDRSLPVDALFYGKTIFGEEIRELEADGEILVDKRDINKDPELAETNFSFHNQHKLPGEVQYVYAQMRHFMQKEEQKDLKRGGRDAVAITPYREKLLPQNKTRAVTVFQMAGDDAVALKENAVYLASGNDYSEFELPQEANAATAEWDYLLNMYPSTKDDKEIAVGGESESEMTTTSSREGDSSDDNASLAEVEDEVDGMELRNRLDSIMVKTFRDMAAEWKEKKLPRLEEKQAWKVWKKTKKSRRTQEDLLARSKIHIEHLDARLASFKEAMKKEEWSTEAQVQAQCKAMQPTVEDIEHEIWKMDVWRRKKEPFHVIRRTQTSVAGVRPSTAAPAGPRIHVPESDRLSVEPAHASMNLDDEEFHSAQSSLVDAQDDTAPGYAEDRDASDEMSEHDGFIFDDEEDAVMESSGEVVRTPDKIKSEHRKRPASVCRSQINAEAGDDSDLASPLAFFNSQRPTNNTPARPSSTFKLPTEIIDISSDSTPAKSKRGRKKGMPNKKPTFSQDPTTDTAKDVASWELQDLIKNRDTKRILIKLLSEVERTLRKDLAKMITMRRIPWFSNAVTRQLRKFKDSLAWDTADATDEKPVLLATRLHLAVNYTTSPRSIMDATGAQGVDLAWNSIIEDTGQARTFVGMLQQMLDLPRLFDPPKLAVKSRISKFPSSGVISLLESVENPDEDESYEKSPKKGKKKIALGNKAQQSQAAAFKRQKKFNMMGSQASNSQELQAMIQSDPSMSTIPINIATKGEDQDFILIDKQIASQMKEHQVNGVRFMWRELTAQGDDEGQGCILAHTMGLGKTMQAIAVLVAINEAAQSRTSNVSAQLPEHLRLNANRQLRMLVLCPPALISNWRSEINKWASHVFKNVFVIESGTSDDLRVDQLKTWHKLGGVLLTGYQLFLSMVSETGDQGQDDNRTKAKRSEYTGQAYQKYLLQSPEIVVADEAHTLKNDKAAVSKAARKIRTESRIGLTGTPMSNDVDEVYSLVSWVAPDYLGERGWFTQQYSRPIKEGNSIDSTEYERRRSLKKLAVLHRQIEPKVNRADITVLKGSLRSKVEYVVSMPLTAKQDAAYRRFLAVLLRNDDKDSASNTRIFSWLAVLTLLLNHPLAFKRKLLAPVKPPAAKRKAKTIAAQSSDATLEASDSGSATPAPPGDRGIEDAEDATVWDKIGDIDNTLHALGFSDDTVQNLIADIDDDLAPALSSKMSMLIAILNRSKRCNDKVLVFTSSIPTLDYVAQLLAVNGYRCGRIDGTVHTSKRQRIVDEFNSGLSDVMIISTRAGSVGLNIQAANRVVILDSGFNPAHEEQAIGRAYRLGQEKSVYVYRLIIGGTFEDNIYNKQLFKQSLTSRVVDKKNPKRSATADTREWLFEPRDSKQDRELRRWLGKDEDVLDQILNKQIKADESSSAYSGPIIRSLVTTETLQEDAKDEPLNEDEQREVQEELAMRLNTRVKGKKVSATQTASQTAMPPPTAPQSMQASRAGPSKTVPASSIAKAHPPAQGLPSRIVSLPLPPPAAHGLPMPPAMPSLRSKAGQKRPTNSA